MMYHYRMVIVLALILGGVTIHADYLNDTISEVIHAITTEAYYPIDVHQASVKALDAFSRQVDEYTRFLGPEDYNELLATTNGDYYGIGIEVGPKKDDEEFLMIMHVKPGSPAEAKGIKRYDKIIAIDETPVGPLSLDDSLKKIRGKVRYSPVKITIMRDSKPQTMTLKRDQMTKKTSWCAHLPQQNIVYCHIGLFTHQVTSQIQKALKKGLAKKPRGIILDLRDNAGGVLRAAVDCASLFVPQASHIVSTKNRDGKVLEQYSTSSKPLVPKRMPVIILVNQYTASSAEILAQALRFHRKTTPYFYIVGTQTYGKGSVQDVRPIGSHCALKLTTALYYLPDGSTIHAKGVTPDIIIKQKYPEPEDIKLLNKLYRQRIPRIKAPHIQDYDSLRLKALKKDHQITCACNIIMLLDHAKAHTPAKVSTSDKALTWLQQQYVVPKSMKAQVL